MKRKQDAERAGMAQHLREGVYTGLRLRPSVASSPSRCRVKEAIELDLAVLLVRLGPPDPVVDPELRALVAEVEARHDLPLLRPRALLHDEGQLRPGGGGVPADFAKFWLCFEAPLAAHFAKTKTRFMALFWQSIGLVGPVRGQFVDE